MFENILEKPNKKVILLGNEAIVRGALEAGVQFVSTYPGTPASEIGNSFYQIQNSKDKIKSLYFEFSVNEKVAIEAAGGASFSGLRSLVAMKNFGLNVASDFLLPLVYSGVKGGMVILIADDPSCHSSAQSEENSRAFAALANIPVLEPSIPQECKDFIKFAFDLSEKFEIPIMIRETTRVAHQSAPVKLDKLKTLRTVLHGKFIKDNKKFVTMPPRVMEMHKELLDKIEKIREYSEKSKLNLIRREAGRDPTSARIGGGRVSAKLGIITSGVSYLYVKEALKELNISLPVLKLGFFHPLPEKKIKNFIKNLDKVLIVEELEPYLENEVIRMAKEVNCDLKIIGKDLVPEVGELKPEIVIQAIAKFTDKKLELFGSARSGEARKIPRRHPQLCHGCPYWLVFGGVKKAAKGMDVIFGGDIGCYMLAGFSPHNVQDYLYCMGSSIGIAHGIKKVSEQKLITFIGDSTFFHSGITGLINTVFNKSNPLIIIMNNSTTAMTGHQPHPSAPTEPDGVSIENIVKACGVKHLKTIDPVKQEEFVKAIKDFLNKKEVSVIIAKHPCKFVQKK
ncbi:indolepyruvate ferredoxin oxidoreductase subunit alpha [Candidatus Parcubacteria bacterium]|nr:indolepyruvate ferredoxin oxidoreductase subunit alpha [Candidatus Parcubacteria bacterium]